MKKKALGLSILALLVLLSAGFTLTSFAQAATIVPASVHVTGPPTITNGDVATLPSGVVQLRDYGFSIPNLLTIGTDEYNTLSVSTFDGQYNPQTGIEILHFTGAWTVVGSDPSSGFAGQIEIKEFNFDENTHTGSPVTVHVVAHGFGIFAGQTLKLDLSGPSTFNDWTGVCIIPQK
jgi:hypothetical protein